MINIEKQRLLSKISTPNSKVKHLIRLRGLKVVPQKGVNLPKKVVDHDPKNERQVVLLSQIDHVDDLDQRKAERSRLID